MLSLVVVFVKWLLVIDGVVCQGRGPTHYEQMGWFNLNKSLTRRYCKVCRQEFWTWKYETKTCHRFGCYRKAHNA